ncbi:MAG: peptidase dimerization domain protein, partial [Bacteroidota bacterium]
MNTLPYIEQHKDRFIQELFDLLRIPSISADPAYKADVVKTAELVKQSLEDIGMDNAQLCETPGYPIVYAEKIIDPSLPTVLVYGHYDVQPPHPKDLWTTAQFEPEIIPTEIH